MEPEFLPEPGAMEWDDQIDDLFPADDDSVPYVQSPASRELLSEMRRYAGRRTAEGVFKRQQIPGRSVLISGQRGSGKTGTVQWVIRHLNAELRRQREAVRVLYVPIQSSSWSSDPEQLEKSVLIELFFGLHRAVIRECLICLRQRIRSIAPLQSHPEQAEARLHELLAQLEQEFQNHLQPRHLRDLWSRLKFLDPQSRWGTAFFSRTESGRRAESGNTQDSDTIPSSAPDQPALKPRLPLDQGVCELNLLTTLNEVYLRLVGELSDEEANPADVAKSRESVIARLLELPELKQVLGGLLGAGLASAGASGLGTPAQVFFGLAGAVGSALALSWVGLEKFSPRSSRQRKFVRKYSADTLNREVDRVIDALLNAGLAPVFVIDELDKLDKPTDTIRRLAASLKQFFAERAFFCFLTHRQFYDELQRRELKHPTDVTTTWFGRKLFVEHHPWEIRKHIRRACSQLVRTTIVVVENPLNPDGPRDVVGNAQDDDAVIWEYVIVFRAGPSFSRLNQELMAFQRQIKDGSYRIGQIFIPDTSWRIEALMQVVFELQLEKFATTAQPGEMHIVQLLCQLIRQKWLEGISISWSGDDDDKLRAELSQIVADEVASGNSHRSAVDEISSSLWSRLTGTIASIHQCFGEFGELIVRIELQASSHHPGLGDVELNQSLKDLLPLLRIASEDESPLIYHWNYKPDGSRFEDVARNSSADPKSEILRWQQIMNHPELSVHEPNPSEWIDGPVNYTRLQQCGLLKKVPSAIHVKDALRTLNDTKSSGVDKRKAEQLLYDFSQMLVERAELLAITLQVSAVLGRLQPDMTPVQRLSKGINSLEKWLLPGRSGPEGIGKLLTKVGQQLPRVLLPQDLNLLPAVPPVKRIEVRTFLSLSSRSPMSGSDIADLLGGKQWQIWNWLFESHPQQSRRSGSNRRKAQLPDHASFLMCEAAGLPSAALLRPQLTRLSVGDWSRLLIRSLTDRITPEIFRIPVRAGITAMRWLGLSSAIPLVSHHLTDRITEEDQEMKELLSDEHPVHLQDEDTGKTGPSSARVTFSVLLCLSDRSSTGLGALLPDSTHPCICLTKAEALSFASVIQELAPGLQIASLFIEEPEAVESLDEIVQPLRPLISPHTKIVGVFQKVPAVHVFEWVVKQPRSLADLSESLR